MAHDADVASVRTDSDRTVSTSVVRKAIPTVDRLSLRAEWSIPADPTRVAVLCHPHPLHGGNMYASVIDHLFRHLPGHGFATLRFNFRGVQGSDGRHDHGRGERIDALAAIDEASSEFPGLPLLMVGWSFGGDITLATPHPAIHAWCAIAPSLRTIAPSEMAAGSDQRPATIIVPANDQFAAPALVEAETESWPTTSIAILDGADHFLAGSLDEVLILTIASLEV